MSAARFPERAKSPGLCVGASTGCAACCSRALSNALNAMEEEGAFKNGKGKRKGQNLLVDMVQHDLEADVLGLVKLATGEPLRPLAMLCPLVGGMCTLPEQVGYRF